MAAGDHPRLSGVPETLLIPVYVRAVESGRPDALLRDELAEALVAERPMDFVRVTKIRMDDEDRAALILRNREIDQRVRDFLHRQSPALVVHIGCGLDQRFERVDDSTVEWLDLDLPEVVELRRELLADPGPRYHLVSGSVLEHQWEQAARRHPDRPVLFVAEGVLMYFTAAQVRHMVTRLRDQFPGSELVFDAFSPLLVRANNLRLRLSPSPIGARYSWGLRHPKDVEHWADGVQLLDEWHPLDRPEARLSRSRWMRHIPLLANIMGVYHYRLGGSS